MFPNIYNPASQVHGLAGELVMISIKRKFETKQSSFRLQMRLKMQQRETEQLEIIKAKREEEHFVILILKSLFCRCIYVFLFQNSIFPLILRLLLLNLILMYVCYNVSYVYMLAMRNYHFYFLNSSFVYYYWNCYIMYCGYVLFSFICS